MSMLRLPLPQCPACGIPYGLTQTPCGWGYKPMCGCPLPLVAQTRITDQTKPITQA